MICVSSKRNITLGLGQSFLKRHGKQGQMRGLGSREHVEALRGPIHRRAS